MSMLDKIANRFGYQKHQEEPKKKGVILPWDEVPEKDAGTFAIGEAPPPLKAEDYLKEAKSWVYSCISVIADEVAEIELHLYQKKGDKVEEVFNHQLLDDLYKVNDFTTKFDHFWLTQQYLDLVGEAPWLLDREENRINGIYLLRPDKLTINFNKESIIGGYTYKVGFGKEVEFEKEDIIFLRYPSTTTPFRGRGTLEAVAQTVNLDNYAEQWNMNFFYNSARPDLILSTEGKLTDAQMKRLSYQWRKKFRGLSKAFKLAILEGGLKVDKLQFSQRDMDFLNQMRFSRDKILSIFRVPKTAIGITEDVNRANAEATDYVFASRTIKPKMRRIVEQLNEFLVPFYGDDLYLDFKDPVPENRNIILKDYENSLANGWRSINEVRTIEGLPPVENGDAPMLPLSLIPVGEPTKGKAMPTGAISLGKPIRVKKKKEYSEMNIILSARKSVKEKKTEEIKKELKKIIKTHLTRESGKKNEGKKVSKNTPKSGVKKQKANLLGKTDKDRGKTGKEV